MTKIKHTYFSEHVVHFVYAKRRYLALMSVNTEQSLMLCKDYPNSIYAGLMHGDGAGSASLSVPADRLMPVHPDVRLKPLAFYDVIAELLKPSTLSECQSCCTNCYLLYTLVHDLVVVADAEDDLIKSLDEWKDDMENRRMRVYMNKIKVTISREYQKLMQQAVRWPCGRGVGSNSIQCPGCQKKCSGYTRSVVV